jgi:hypothetical protein
LTAGRKKGCSYSAQSCNDSADPEMTWIAERAGFRRHN